MQLERPSVTSYIVYAKRQTARQSPVCQLHRLLAAQSPVGMINSRHPGNFLTEHWSSEGQVAPCTRGWLNGSLPLNPWLPSATADTRETVQPGAARLSAAYIFLLQGWCALCGRSERQPEPQKSVGIFVVGLFLNCNKKLWIICSVEIFPCVALSKEILLSVKW